jgi:hypothetical protein
MTKKKQKTAKRMPKIQFARLARLKGRPALAGLVFVLVAIPTSWMLVNAQSSNGLDAFNGSGGSHKPGSAQEASASSAKGPGAKVSDKGAATKNDAAKKADDKKASAGGTSTTGAAGTPATSPPPAPPAPAPAPPVTPPTGLHQNIKTTIFWVGEAAGPDNANISNAESAWDGNWQTHFGGFDDPDNRNGYHPAAFTPLENPFYFALPYNDLNDNGDRKASAANCPNVGGSVSWCKNAWIKITKGSKVAYAQWEDVGPLKEDDVAYVFGTAAPANTWGAKAGLDVSPAVRDYMGLSDVDVVSWTFVAASSVPAGPWKQIVTTSPGGW